MSEQTAAEATERNHRKVRRGYVVSDKMDKTVVVLVEERYKHSLYGKVLRRSKKVKVHDEANSAHVGDLVSIMETRPLSATKRWRLVEIVEKAPGAPGCVRRARRRPACRAVPALPRSAPRSVVVVIGATWGFTLRGRGTLRSGEQMHRRQVPLASFAPSGNTDKLAKLYV